MKIYKFEEQLNDLFDYFILADPFTLLEFKKQHNLPNDLITTFTTTDFGEIAVRERKMIPLSQVQNYPYTIYFNLMGENIELLKPQNDLQIHQKGYLLEVQSEIICLFTIPYLKDFTVEKIDKLLKNRKAQIKLPKGLYSISILGGQTCQKTGKEPTFEFIILPVEDTTTSNPKINVSFKIESSEY
ncbi:hypothetical protein [Bernardetia sp.]|uniref:hypothetical protein n=1 Tax=Bernardetia sp. TaxID=1937974 RepID=UPI0025BEDEAC|nr:hypothetical protein [Bernardetia sp.]